MATPTNIDDCSFRVVAQSWGVNFDGADTLTEVQKGAASFLTAADSSFVRFSTHTTYPNMYLINKTVEDRGPVAQITLQYIGVKESFSPDSGLVSVVDDILDSSVQLVSDEEESVSFKYFAQATTYTWLSRSSTQPTDAKYGFTAPTDIPTGYLYAPSPPSYNGSFASSYTINTRLNQFNVTRIVPSLWRVVETWKVIIDPV